MPVVARKYLGKYFAIILFLNEESLRCPFEVTLMVGWYVAARECEAKFASPIAGVVTINSLLKDDL